MSKKTIYHTANHNNILCTDYNQIYEPELVEYNIDSSCSCKPRYVK